jgi:hypothetical protein
MALVVVLVVYGKCVLRSKNSGEFRASGMFSAEGIQRAELREKLTIATCSLETVSISA